MLFANIFEKWTREEKGFLYLNLLFCYLIIVGNIHGTISLVHLVDVERFIEFDNFSV